MSLLKRLSQPRLPRSAFVLDAAELAAVELNRRGARFDLSSAARMPLAPGLLTPSFDGRNVPLPNELATAMDETARAAGLGRRQRWSILLPEDAVKALVVSLESVPGSRDELTSMLGWKVERMVGVSAADLRVTRQLVGSGDRPRFLVVAARETVMAEYESLLKSLDWQAGLIVPRFVGEAAWFDWDTSPGDKLLVGARGATCVAAVVRNGDLLLVRTIDGEPSRLQDEIYRVALFYRDRVASSPSSAGFTSVLTSESIDAERVSDAVADALGSRPALFEPVRAALDTGGAGELDQALLAAAGMATQAWNR